MKKAVGINRALVLGVVLLMAILITVIFLLIPRLHAPEPGHAPSYWPTQGWQSCSPEQQGIDSSKLAEGLQTIRAKDIDIHSLLIIRNGQVLADANFYPYDGQTVHDLASVTKSLMTTLIGIAADQGKLQLDQPMVSFFPERTIANRDARKESITVRHLASMTSGLKSLGLERDEGTLTEMQTNDDWVQFALDRPVVSEPGTQFVYDSPGMHLLSAILQKATGMTALEFAQQNLFDPLNIRDVIWPTDPQGFSRGWGDVHLYPRDAAKIGYLWLNRGRWEGRQIISSDWVANSVKVQNKTGMDDDYGYGWWIMSGGTYAEFAAVGRGGQRIHVIPDLNLILVTTGGGFNIDDVMPFLTPALINPGGPLPANPMGLANLNSALAAIVQAPAPNSVAPLPAIAKAISGQTYVLDFNPAQLKSVRLDFNDSVEAALQLTFGDNRPSSPQQVGLDGVYRLAPGDYNLPLGLRGHWVDAQTFMLERDTIANNDHATYVMTFTDNQVVIKGQETAHELGITFTGRLQNSN